MANDTYNLTQTGAQVQTIVNDANKVMGAGTQTTLTTDYVMLKDTSGNYHKIDKSSFTEAVRNTLASLLVNNDKGTTFGQIPVINSGDFGSATPANLASVLGALKYKGNIDDANSVIGVPGIYGFSSSSLNKPFEYCFVLSFDYPNTQYGIQVAFNISSGHSIAFRTGQGAWKYLDGLTE